MEETWAETGYKNASAADEIMKEDYPNTDQARTRALVSIAVSLDRIADSLEAMEKR